MLSFIGDELVGVSPDRYITLSIINANKYAPNNYPKRMSHLPRDSRIKNNNGLDGEQEISLNNIKMYKKYQRSNGVV